MLPLIDHLESLTPLCLESIPSLGLQYQRGWSIFALAMRKASMTILTVFIMKLWMGVWHTSMHRLALLILEHELELTV